MEHGNQQDEREISLDIVNTVFAGGSKQDNVQEDKGETSGAKDTDIMIAIQNDAQNGIPDEGNRQETTIQNPPLIPQNIEPSRDSEFTPTALPLLENNDSSQGSVFVPKKLTYNREEAEARAVALKEAAKRERKQKQKFKGIFPCIPYMSQTLKITIASITLAVTIGSTIGALFATGVIHTAMGGANSGGSTSTTSVATPTITYEPRVQVSTFAGTGTAGKLDGSALTAQFNNSNDIACDSVGNVYIADSDNHIVRRISAVGIVSTFAGNGTKGFADGPVATAMFDTITGVALDPAGDIIVTDALNHKIRKITQTGIVSTLAGNVSGFLDGAGAAAQFNVPFGLAVNVLGEVFVADRNNHVLRKVSPSGVVTTVAGQPASAGNVDGPAANSQFRNPVGVAIDSNATIYIADTNNHRFRKVSNGTVSTIAGSIQGYRDDVGLFAMLRAPIGIAVDATGTLFVTEF